MGDIFSEVKMKVFLNIFVIIILMKMGIGAVLLTEPVVQQHA